jgi:hypothetical protein
MFDGLGTHLRRPWKDLGMEHESDSQLCVHVTFIRQMKLLKK